MNLDYLNINNNNWKRNPGADQLIKDSLDLKTEKCNSKFKIRPTT